MRYQIFSSLLVVVFVSVVPQAHAQCSRSGSELIVDGSFNNGCSNWSYAGNAGRLLNDWCTTGWSGGFGRGDASDIYQTTTADAGGSNFSMSYDYRLHGVDSLHSAVLTTSITDLNTNAVTMIDEVAGPPNSSGCVTRSFSLGSHPEWVGHNLQVTFETVITAPSGVFDIKNVSLTESN
jgi:hypothetical protein